MFFPTVTPVYLPIAWADRYAAVNPSQVRFGRHAGLRTPRGAHLAPRRPHPHPHAQANQVKSSIYVARDLMLAARWGGVALAALSVILCVTFFYVGWKRKRLAEQAREMEAAKYYAEYYR